MAFADNYSMCAEECTPAAWEDLLCPAYSDDVCEAPPVEYEALIGQKPVVSKEDANSPLSECILQTNGSHARTVLPTVCDDVARAWYADRYESADESTRFAGLMRDVGSSKVRTHLIEIRRALLQGPVLDLLSTKLSLCGVEDRSRFSRAIHFLRGGLPDRVNTEERSYEVLNSYFLDGRTMVDLCRAPLQDFSHTVNGYYGSDVRDTGAVGMLDQRCRWAEKAWTDLNQIVGEAVRERYPEAKTDLYLSNFYGNAFDRSQFYLEVTLHPSGMPVRISANHLLSLLQG